MANRTVGSKPTVEATVVRAADIAARNRVNAEQTRNRTRNRRDPDTGRFVPVATETTVTRLDSPPSPKIPEIGAGLAQALLDADAEAWRTRQVVQTAERLISAIEFGDRIGAGS